MVGELAPCAGCSEAMEKRIVVPWNTDCRSNQPLQPLFVDLSNKRPHRLVVRNMYGVMILGDYPRVTWPYFSETSDVSPVFGSPDIRAQGHPCTMACLCSDNGTEFLKQEFMALLGHHGLRREYTPVDSPKNSNVAER